MKQGFSGVLGFQTLYMICSSWDILSTELGGKYCPPGQRGGFWVSGGICREFGSAQCHFSVRGNWRREPAHPPMSSIGVSAQHRPRGHWPRSPPPMIPCDIWRRWLVWPLCMPPHFIKRRYWICLHRPPPSETEK